MIFVLLRHRVPLPEGFFSESDLARLAPSELRHVLVEAGAELLDLFGGWDALIEGIDVPAHETGAVRAVHHEVIRQAIGNFPTLRAAARHLGWDESTLYRYRKKHGLPIIPGSGRWRAREPPDEAT